MNVVQTKIDGVVIIEPKYFGDERGFFAETWNRQRYVEAGINADFVQDNLSFSQKGVLRGLHFQNPNPQGKLVQVLQGSVFDVAVDIRVGSPTFGEWTGVVLSDENRRQFFVPEGFAHGFCVLSDTALFAYKCTNAYNPAADAGIAWNDPELDIKWPVDSPTLSEKDSKLPLLSQISEEKLVTY